MNTSIAGAMVEGGFAGTHSFSFSNGVRDGVAESQLFLLYCAKRAGWERESILGRSSVEAEDLKIDSFSIIHAELSLESLQYPGVCFLQCEVPALLMPFDVTWQGLSLVQVCINQPPKLPDPRSPGLLSQPPQCRVSCVSPVLPALLGWITFKIYSSHTPHPPPPDGLTTWNSGFPQFLQRWRFFSLFSELIGCTGSLSPQMRFLVLASGGQSQAEVSGFLSAVASVDVVRRLSCSANCGIFLEQGLNLCPLHWTTRAVLGGISEGLEL